VWKGFKQKLIPCSFTFACSSARIKFVFMQLRASILFLQFFFLFIFQESFPQKQKKADRITLSNLESEIKTLADDRLEGRRTGTPGEKLASEYISGEFQKIGLAPKGDHGGWLQSFEVYDGKQINPGTHFFINNAELIPDQEYFPLSYSALNSVEGTPAIALQESGVPWFIDCREILETNAGNPHFDMENAIHSKIKACVKKGATAVIFYNSSKTEDHIVFNPKDRSPTESIPVLYITKDGERKYLKDESASLDVRISVDLGEMIRTGHNVIAGLDNGSATTVIIGAHYDHLGYGEDGNSLYRGNEKLIHHGADDNASGVAAMIELARLIKQEKSRKNNYLFIAFSGEELGLLGSKYFTDHPSCDLKAVNFMLNMDMVGRLNDSTHGLTIGGYGTSPAWGELLNGNTDKNFFKIKFDSSGTGPSDYTSFYRKDIPVLFFFTGIHADYHKPSDDYKKINYPGELEIVKWIYSLLQNLDRRGKLAFTKTREAPAMGSVHFSVTLGIMPDYSFNGNGVRVDGISDGRPAQLAGLKTGDIILRLGDYPVSSLESYMEALSKFKKGDTTKLQFKRGNDLTEAAVQF
jgi:aminopeptidase YwaD